ncbi:MAG: GNAT family N-acetyltransferase [Proteobacteria bacterium]|uniref:GNAT family N-acetyltransferase n=1 Tax=Candidatus Avisuccinivibrio stercorigallinarum TaxID=2840704 RepID=A0A9D9D8I7_9GAMM|nr:GNAT family N-acetyltransferase [Candidatus Avisuccinivibrio stercorigallinarum]
MQLSSSSALCSVRPLRFSDLKALSQALSAIWFSYDKEHRRSEKLFCLDYLFSCLGKSNLCLVLHSGEKPAAAVILHLPGHCQASHPGRYGAVKRLIFKALKQLFSLCIRLDPYCREGSRYHQRYGENYVKLGQMVSGHENKGEIVLLFADPALQGRGLGRTLMQAAEDAFRECGVQDVFLLTDVNCNYGLYPHLGWNLSKTVRLDFSAVKNSGEYVFNCFIYEKQLKA